MPKTSTKVSVHIVTWNSNVHLRTCFHALDEQTSKEWSLMVVDNASLDGTVKWLHEHYPATPVLKNTRNLGFSRAHNQAILLTQSAYILVMNPDIVLEPEWIARAVTWMDEHPEFGAIGGKTLRYTYSNDELNEVQQSGIIDSTGIKMLRSRHVIDRGTGQSDVGQFEVGEDVFGLSGACVMFRRQALEQARYKDEYFDDNFFAYKEDVDLAWRLQRLGWRARYESSLRAFHHRHIRGVAASSDALIARNHRSRTSHMSYLSYRNHWLMLLKNERWATFWRDGLYIVWYELKKSIFLLFVSPTALRGLGDVLRLQRLMKKKATLLDHRATVTTLAVRQAYFT